MWSSSTEQQKGSEAALICTRFQEGTWVPWSLTHSTFWEAEYTAHQLKQEMLKGMELSFLFFGPFFLKAFEQFTAINKHIQRRNRVSEGSLVLTRKPVRRWVITRTLYSPTSFFQEWSNPLCQLPKALGSALWRCHRVSEGHNAFHSTRKFEK